MKSRFAESVVSAGEPGYAAVPGVRLTDGIRLQGKFFVSFHQTGCGRAILPAVYASGRG